MVPTLSLTELSVESISRTLALIECTEVLIECTLVLMLTALPSIDLTLASMVPTDATIWVNCGPTGWAAWLISSAIRPVSNGQRQGLEVFADLRVLGVDGAHPVVDLLSGNQGAGQHQHREQRPGHDDYERDDGKAEPSHETHQSLTS